MNIRFLVRHTANASEQALRNAVIYRKVTGGFRSNWGATAYANVISVIETARRRGHNVLHTLMDLLSNPFDLGRGRARLLGAGYRRGPLLVDEFCALAVWRYVAQKRP